MIKCRIHKLKMITAAALLACFLTGPISAASTSSYAGKVTTLGGKLNVRASGSVYSEVLTTLENGAVVTVADYSGGWYMVEYAEDQYGWVSGSYLKSAGGEAAFANISYGTLNVRAGGSTSQPKVGALAAGEYFVVLGESNGWSSILYDGVKRGWVLSDYVSATAAASSESQTGYARISLSVADYKQYDSCWASRTLGGTSYTVRASGCTLCSYSMVESYRTSSSYTPLTALYERSFTSGGALIWPSSYERWYGGAYLEKLYEKLADGKPVMIEVKNTSGRSHWVVVTGYDGSRTLSASGFSINDPGSDVRDTLDELLAAYPEYCKLTWYN